MTKTCYLSHLECGLCGERLDADRLWNLYPARPRMVTVQADGCAPSAAPEGGATLAAFLRLRKGGWIRDGESVVLFNTGNGAKYSHIWD